MPQQINRTKIRTNHNQTQQSGHTTNTEHYTKDIHKRVIQEKRSSQRQSSDATPTDRQHIWTQLHDRINTPHK